MTAEVTIRIVQSLGDVGRDAWDSVANPGWRMGPGGRLEAAGPTPHPFNPFVTHDFLWTLEETGCATDGTGWHARHLLMENAAGAVVAAAPAYLKTHSQGEYVFDHGWANAFQRAGGRYYPKVQVSVPFTPVTGRRLLVGDVADPEAHAGALGRGIAELARRSQASSAHVTFLPEPEWRLLGEEDFLLRTDQQFHWLNEEYRGFEDFLANLASRKRKTIRRERRDAVADGIAIEWVTGAAITEAHWDAFFAFYMDTGSRKWGRPYLNRRFFSRIGERMAERILLVMAKRAGRWIAGAINFIGSDALYGRNWGAVEDHPFLHFEVCYHQAIDFAIAHRLARVEAGAQGEHKLARGYRPVTTWSAHWIAEPGFRRAIEDYLLREREAVAEAQEELAAAGPFRRGPVQEED